MPKATWNNITIADTTDTVVVEGNHYFPLSAIDPAMLKPSTTTISIRLPQSLLDSIKLAANARDVPYQSLIKVWLQERVRA